MKALKNLALMSINRKSRRQKRAARMIRGAYRAVAGRSYVNVFGGKTKINIPKSTPNKLIFPLSREANAFCTADFSTQWAEGRITLQEIERFLDLLKAVDGYDAHTTNRRRRYGTSSMRRCLVARQKNFNNFFIMNESNFSSRGLKFRSGAWGAWISLEKFGPAPAGFAANQFQGSQQQMPNQGAMFNSMSNGGPQAQAGGFNPFGTPQQAPQQFQQSQQQQQFAKPAMNFPPNPHNGQKESEFDSKFDDATHPF